MELESSVILFQPLREAVLDNKNMIESLSRDLSRYMLVGPEMQPIFNMDYSTEIKAIRDEINSNRTENRNIAAFIELVTKTADKYHIQISKNQAGLPESCNITGAIMRENQLLQALSATEKANFTNEIITAADMETRISGYRSKRENRIAEIGKAQTEIQKFIDSISTGSDA